MVSRVTTLMEVIALLVLFKIMNIVQTHPIDNGFVSKFNPLSSKEIVKLENILSELNKPVEEKQETLFYDFKSDYPNESAKKQKELRISDYQNYLSMPVFRQSYQDYMLLIAKTPPNFTMGPGLKDKKLVVYVVVPDGPFIDEIPRVYFVKESISKKKTNEEHTDPILIIDNNRTVTGLRSREIAKCLHFRNKLTNRLKYSITPSK